ncbi:hypothetical protein CHISP_2311 [Chitinispirillum alkaliphilum]|nr:hypothetical protein CHISP_2311 [Chitinispirillum alkaliphilum]
MQKRKNSFIVLAAVAVVFLLNSCTRDPENMVLIRSAGTSFTMGDNRVHANTGPAHEVRFTYDFWIDTVPVTQENFKTVMGRNPSHFAGNMSHPVEMVTWYDAVLYCNARSKMHNLDTVYVYTDALFDSTGRAISLENLVIRYEARGYRLPTEAEWEFAARAGATEQFFWGDEMDEEYVWYIQNSLQTTRPVAEKKPNAWGLHDMAGNVWEWCNDWFAGYSSEVKNDPTGPEDGVFKVMRGGSWHNIAPFLRVAYRTHNAPDYSYYALGFRCVKVN